MAHRKFVTRRLNAASRKRRPPRPPKPTSAPPLTNTEIAISPLFSLHPLRIQEFFDIAVTRYLHNS